jgi:hypothetical protein
MNSARNEPLYFNLRKKRLRAVTGSEVSRGPRPNDGSARDVATHHSVGEVAQSRDLRNWLPNNMDDKTKKREGGLKIRTIELWHAHKATLACTNYSTIHRCSMAGVMQEGYGGGKVIYGQAMAG